MNISKADFDTIIRFGSLDDFERKLLTDGLSIDDVIDNVDSNGVSLLQRALISRKFDIARHLLNHGAKTNVISKDGYNDLHYIAANIDHPGAIELATKLIESGNDLNHRDNIYLNTAALSLCLEILKKRTADGMMFLQKILSYGVEKDSENRSGVSLRKVLAERLNA